MAILEHADFIAMGSVAVSRDPMHRDTSRVIVCTSAHPIGPAGHSVPSPEEAPSHHDHSCRACYSVFVRSSDGWTSLTAPETVALSGDAACALAGLCRFRFLTNTTSLIKTLLGKSWPNGLIPLICKKFMKSKITLDLFIYIII